ncbi:tetratricopeptide repeat protein [Paludisphaera rhizosphaerae]|uniref:tetratricopeptide repeat protein n=1 Tax=Paludisphaera rhizosphaerae TaxID=2711216 RepID=UPI0013EBEA1E|nr:tetratricopeptide repeat protein [Paludisphaera rhizosphaerae]
MTRSDASSSPSGKPHRDDDDPRRAVPSDAEGVATPEGDDEPEAQPEPWTPERVTEWNAYYDLYVLGAVLLLAFVTSAVRTNHAPLWSNLQMGREIIRQGSPVLTDSFSYTEEGKRWVNVPWLFQTVSAAVYDMVYGMVPESQDDPTAHRASAEQVATGALVALTALLRLATAFVLIKVRHKGPGLWWSAVCTALALGAAVAPGGLMLGGIGQPAIVDSTTWSTFFLAVEVLLLFRAFQHSSRFALYALIPLFLLWANVDPTFLLGLLIFGAATLGRFLDGKKGETPASSRSLRVEETDAPPPITAALAGVILSVCALVAVLNPSHIWIYPAALEPITSFFSGSKALPTLSQLSYFGPTIRSPQYGGVWHLWMIFYFICVGGGLATFVLNAKGFSWARLLPFVVVAVAWAFYIRYAAEFAVVLAAVATLNGQEWYQRKFGTSGRLGSGWTTWSTGGRLVTLALLFICTSMAITGYGKSLGDLRFGFGFDPDDFSFKAADFLATSEGIKGNVFNWSLGEGDAIVWKAGPTRKTFVDSRSLLFPSEIQEKHRTLLNALRDDDAAVWKPILDEYKISAVMVDESAPNTRQKLSQSPNWIPFYDDGRVTMFGRADAAEPDVVTFRDRRLEPERRAYKLASPSPAPDRPPTPVEFIDDIVRSRSLTPPRSQTNAARRWLAGGTNPDGTPAPPDPARCLMAIREARGALAQNPDDFSAYRLLAIAYRALAQQEAALISGIKLTPENRDRIAAIKPSGTLMNERIRQVVTALKYAVETTPPVRTQQERMELISLHFDLFDAYSQLGFVDLARDELQAVFDTAKAGDLNQEARAQYQTTLDQYNQQIGQIEQAMSSLQIERQAGPIELGQFALNQGAVGLAITQFEDADRSNLSPTVVKPQLVDLYCSTGQPERSLEIIKPSAGADPNLGEPSIASFRQGLVYKLMGNYSYASMLWQTQALPRLAYDRTNRALGVAVRSMHGDLVATTNEAAAVGPMLSRQASWEFDTAQCLLEWGEPQQAAVHFAKALELSSDLAVKPLIEYYLDKLGKPEPVQPAATAPAPAPTPAEAPKPAAPAEVAKPEAAKAP